jgi:hypothetical protein
MRALHVSPATQTLVFSKTSFQRDKISPRAPRALYFNDDIYLGFCQHGDVVEIASTDPQQGTVFYTASQHEANPRTLLRQTDNCLQCHASSATNNVPGLLLRSVYPDDSGLPVLSAGTFRTTYQSPFKERWGGWYVSGSHGKMRHMGNAIATSADHPDQLDEESGANVADLSKLVNVKPYLTPHSDIVALMVLEHQAPTHNQITQANYQGRMALIEEAELRKMDGDPHAPRSAGIQARFDSMAEQLLDDFLFVGEAPLTDRVHGSSDFTAYFSGLGPRDKRGRSLRDFDLTTRLFKYPCSYLIYSAAFDSLPAPVLESFYRKLWSVLTGEDQRPKYAHLTATARRAIAEILADTKPGLPSYWHVK